jgi:hypothetical protein
MIPPPQLGRIVREADDGGRFQYGTGQAEKSYFCGCSPDDEKDVGSAIGATVR